MDSPTYSRPSKKLISQTQDTTKANQQPSFSEIQAQQLTELLQLAKAKYAHQELTVAEVRANFHEGLSESEILRILTAFPEETRADVVMNALAKGNMQAATANQLLSTISLLKRWSAQEKPHQA
ncbi:MAG: hypothetical protein RLY27_341 [Pseudomonadota bacterium]|jgi:hypothetical protein|nr:hypothetical protein [Burkholderiales bacterium]